MTPQHDAKMERERGVSEMKQRDVYTKIDSGKLMVVFVKNNSQTVLKPNRTSYAPLFICYRTLFS